MRGSMISMYLEKHLALKVQKFVLPCPEKKAATLIRYEPAL
jgi:hypothetical protein